jgi:hypothetical protein
MHSALLVLVVHADGALTVEHDALHVGVERDDQVGARLHFLVEERIGRAPALTVLLVDLHHADALLVLTVEVVVARDAEAVGGGQVCLRDVVVEGRIGDVQLAALPVVVAGRARLEVLGLAEVRQQLVVAPALAARQRSPVVVVLALAAHVDLSIDGAAAAQHAPAHDVHPAVAEVRLRQRLVHVADGLVVHQPTEADAHLDERVVVLAAGLDEEHAGLAVGGESVGDAAAGRARPDHDVVILGVGHLVFCQLV